MGTSSWSKCAGYRYREPNVSRELIASVLFGFVDPNSLVSGGADSSIKLWDLDEHPVGANHTFRPKGLVSR